MNLALINADQTWALWTILLGCAALGLWAERTAMGARLSGAVIIMLAAFLLSNLNIIPATAPGYEMVWDYLVPLAIPLLLLNTDLRRIITGSGFILTAFMLGACGTVLGVLVAFAILPLDQYDWQLAAVFTATYIGGSMNYVATARAVGLDDSSLLTAGMAADNLMMILYFLILFSLPSLRRLRAYFPEHSVKPESMQSAEVVLQQENRQTRNGGINLPGLTVALTVSLLICTLSFEIEKIIPYQGTAILMITLISLTAATLLRSMADDFKGAQEIGVLIMQIFFATIGACANIQSVLQNGPVLLVFAAVVLLVHLLVILLAGKSAGLSLPQIVIASNANVGGPTTALAMASARGWRELMVPAVLCGTLGYAAGNFIAIAVGNFLKGVLFM